MARYVCPVCGYVYDEAKEGKSWSSLPEHWTCPICGASRSRFEPLPAQRPGKTAASGKPGKTQRSLLGRAAAAHRVFGYVFLAIYVVLLWQMVPRLWTYQIEFPARTVVHLSLGMAVGALLLLKIFIVRFFPRLEASMAPLLGTMILVASVVLIGISVPPAIQEALAGEEQFTEENRQRVQSLLEQTGLDASRSAQLASAQWLRRGQQVLRHKCTGCHDLRTVLARPQTPASWRRTVKRMAERATLERPLNEEEEWQVTAYLVAISPRLQQSARELRRQQTSAARARQEAQAAATQSASSAPYNAALASGLFETKCSQCHLTTVVKISPPASADEARKLVARMVDQGLTATADEIRQIVRYLSETYASKQSP